MMTKPFSRRAFLNALGLGATAGALLPLLNASGQEASMPKRLLLFFTPHGTNYSQWIPTGSGRDFTLAPIMAPLAPYKNYLIPVGNLSRSYGGHSGGVASLWTGAAPDPNTGWADGPSIDQFLAARFGQQTRFPSLLASLELNGNLPNTRMIYAAAQQPIPPNSVPSALYSAMYQSSKPQRTAERRSVLDSIAGRLQAIRAKASAQDLNKIDAHMTAVQELEFRLQAQSVPLTCPVPSASSYGNPTIDLQLTQQFQLLAQAFACDMTRFASMQWSKGDNDGNTFPFLTDPTYFPNGITDGHHTISHAAYDVLGTDGNPVDPKSWAEYVAIGTWFADRLAYFMGLLASIPEGNGSVLDNTLIVWGSEIAQGWSHNSDPAMFLMAGGAGGALNPGQFVNVPDGTQHNRLLVTVLQAMGMTSTQTFGSGDRGSGGLPGLL